MTHVSTTYIFSQRRLALYCNQPYFMTIEIGRPSRRNIPSIACVSDITEKFSILFEKLLPRLGFYHELTDEESKQINDMANQFHHKLKSNNLPSDSLYADHLKREYRKELETATTNINKTYKPKIRTMFKRFLELLSIASEQVFEKTNIRLDFSNLQMQFDLSEDPYFLTADRTRGIVELDVAPPGDMIVLGKIMNGYDDINEYLDTIRKLISGPREYYDSHRYAECLSVILVNILEFAANPRNIIIRHSEYSNEDQVTELIRRHLNMDLQSADFLTL